jgi:hypothetical protein
MSVSRPFDRHLPIAICITISSLVEAGDVYSERNTGVRVASGVRMPSGVVLCLAVVLGSSEAAFLQCTEEMLACLYMQWGVCMS